MGTSAQTIAHLLDVLPAGVTTKKMFGEYALYLGDRVVAFVCDDTLFIKPTAGARALLPEAEMAPAYPGSKDYIVAGDALDDGDLMGRVLRVVAEETPAPKPKKVKR
ncbi:MAG: TfoX/Sxy family protein [Paracoccaceae bacterium]